MVVPMMASRVAVQSARIRWGTIGGSGIGTIVGSGDGADGGGTGDGSNDVVRWRIDDRRRADCFGPVAEYREHLLDR